MSLTADDWERIRAMVTALVRYTTMQGTQADGHGDSVDGYTDGTISGSKGDLGTRRMFPWGFDSRPPAGTEALVLSVGGGTSNAVLVANARDANAPDLDDGEVAIWNKATGAVIKIDKYGNITITTATGKAITVDGTATGTVTVKGSAITLQPTAAVATVPVLLQGSLDSWGVPVTQLVTASNAVKGG